MIRHKHKERGSALIISVAIIATIAVWVLTATNRSQNVARLAQRSRAHSNATAAALGCLDVAYAGWRQVGRTSGTYATGLPTSNFTSIPAPTASNFPDIPGITISNYSVKAVDPQLNALASTSTAPTPATGQNATTTSYYYLASVDVAVPVLKGNVTVKMRRVFEKQNISPWNYAIFYDNDLEMHPGPLQSVTGWVHTNGSLFSGHSSLTLRSRTTFTGDWSIGFMPGESTHSETPTSPFIPEDQPPAPTSTQAIFGIDKTVFSSTNGNTASGYRELIEVPVTGTDPMASFRYYNQAGVRILIDASNVLTITNGTGTVINSSSTGANLALFNTFRNAITTNQSLQDNRETAAIRVASLDVGAITTAVNAGTLTGSTYNGVVYLSDTSGTNTVKRAIRLRNGASLPPAGLTVASNNAVLIQGDYNTGSTSTTKPLSNSGDPSNPTITGYTRRPAAVLGDAVMILSNAWLDANAASGMSSRIATNTTVNAAIVAGIVPSGTSGTNYSGGAENFPRFLEDWSGGKTFTYYGSLVQLWSSQQHTGTWGKSNVYSPPTRHWYFDPNFLTNPPPGTLTTTNFNKQRWYIE